MKKMLIITTSILFTAAFSGCSFSDKKTVNIINNDQGSINKEQETTDNNQQTENDNQETTGSNQNAENTSQLTEKISQTEVVVNQKTEETKNNKNESGKIVNKLVSWGFQKATDRKIDTIVIHSNYNTLSDDPYSVSGALSQFKTYGVSSHYLIDRKGAIYKLVEEKNIAYHAGVSKMKDGRTDVNDFSIGIELLTKDSGDFPTKAQYDALNSLIAGIKKRWPIKYVVGHDDIAPDRKTDPWGFDWGKISK